MERNRGGMGKFVICIIKDKINCVEHFVEMVAEGGMFLGEYSAVVTVGLVVTVLSPGNVKLLLVIPWVLVSVTDMWLNVFMEAEIVKVGTVEARTAEAGQVGNSMGRDTKKHLVD